MPDREFDTTLSDCLKKRGEFGEMGSNWRSAGAKPPACPIRPPPLYAAVDYCGAPF